ncbi:MAG: NERD domain-containing protein [Rhodoferax sp.]|nr:NERD domain-containing protein [Rhodoferax sp.]
MLIKSNDDKSKRLKLLEELQNATNLNYDQKEWLKDQMWAHRMGTQGEVAAAHYLDSYFRDSKSNAVIHDLRIEVDGHVAQIDHLIISRFFEFYLLETKNFTGNLSITEQGEFSVQYNNGRVRGIPSPIEQSKRHELVLRKLLEKLEIKGRLGLSPSFHHVVLVDPKTTITRPNAKKFDTSHVIKADSFMTWRDAFFDKTGTVMNMVGTILKIKNRESLETIARMVAKAHRPANTLELPDFMTPKLLATVAVQVPTKVQLLKPSKPELIQSTDEQTKRYWCFKCNKTLTPAVFNFCMDHKHRFLNRAYCMEHQKDFPYSQ